MLVQTAAGADAGHGGIRREQAEVTTPDGARLLYRETHYVLPGEAGRWVLYRCPDDRPFARKHVHGGTHAMAPDFAFEDGRDGYREGVRSDGGSRYGIHARDRGKPVSRPLAVPDNGVIDAGFDAAVRSRWSELMRGAPVRLQFFIPARERFFPVRLQRVAGIRWHGIRAERLRMTLDTWFGFAVPDVILVYGRDDRRLLEFSGTGNVRDARGRNPQVRIVFQQPPADAAPGELEAIRHVALDGGCRV